MPWYVPTGQVSAYRDSIPKKATHHVQYMGNSVYLSTT